MQKLDRIVALAGALVLVAAVGYAATAEEAPDEYVLAYVPLPIELPALEVPASLPAAGSEGTATFSLSGNVSLVEINLTVRATAASEGSLRAVLVAPNGTTLAEQEVALPAASQAPVAVSLLGFVQPVPENVRAAFPSQADAEAALQGSGNGTGEWRLEYAYSPGLVPAATAVQVTQESRVVLWTGVVAPVTPEGK
jgi:hypothetical protein